MSSLAFRGNEVAGAYTGFTDRPSYADARDIASDLVSAYVDGKVDRVEIVYNRYVSALTQEVTRETLLPLQQATILEGAAEGLGGRAAGEEAEEEKASTGHTALTEYEPDPEDILQRLVPDYVEISLFRALLESTASEHGARMTAMRNASRERRGHHQGPHPADEPRAPGGDHAGDHGSRVRGRGPHLRRRRHGCHRGERDGDARPRTNVGRIEEIQGVVIEAVFPEELPEIYSALLVEREDRDDLVLRGPAAPRRRPRPRGRHGLDGRPRPRLRRRSTPAARSRSRSGARRSAASSTCSASRSTRATRSRRAWTAGRSTVPRRPSSSSRRRRRCSRPASRSSTCSRPTPRAARSACSAAPASARR